MGFCVVQMLALQVYGLIYRLIAVLDNDWLTRYNRMFGSTLITLLGFIIGLGALPIYFIVLQGKEVGNIS